MELNGKALLEHYHKINSEIDGYADRALRLYDRAQGRLTARITGMPKKGGHVDNTDYIIQAMECMDIANEMIREYRPMLKDVLDHIFRVPYSEYRQFLYARYVDGHTYSKIAKDMEISIDWLYKLARKAIAAFEETYSQAAEDARIQ